MAEQVAYKERFTGESHPIKALWEAVGAPRPNAFNSGITEFGWTRGIPKSSIGEADLAMQSRYSGNPAVHLLFAPEGVFIVREPHSHVPLDPTIVDINPILASLATHEPRPFTTGFVDVPFSTDGDGEPVYVLVKKIDLNSDRDVTTMILILDNTEKCNQQPKVPEVVEVPQEPEKIPEVVEEPEVVDYEALIKKINHED